MTRPTYTVTASRGSRRWILQCVDFPGALSEVARLGDAEEVIREAIAFVAEVDDDSFDIDVVVNVAGVAREHIAAAQRLRLEAKRAQSEAAQEVRIAARLLADQGLPVRDIGALLDVSYQRAHQLLAQTPAAHA